MRQVAADLGINPETRRNWVRAVRASRPRGRRTEAPAEPPTPLEAENAALRKKPVFKRSFADRRPVAWTDQQPYLCPHAAPSRTAIRMRLAPRGARPAVCRGSGEGVQPVGLQFPLDQARDGGEVRLHERLRNVRQQVGAG
ncbi:transposase [Streptomyces sp. NPDC005195]|uniref:transposase n=1 Tax=Streptomyces sp. NPDC005195 TaxID=3154561 RepID=UPI0033A8CCAE